QGARRSALALAGRARDQHQAAWLSGNVLERRGQLQIFQLKPLLRHAAEGKGLLALLLAEIGPVPFCSEIKAEIDFPLILNTLSNLGRKILAQHGVDIL